jgi:hypothetical protein
MKRRTFLQAAGGAGAAFLQGYINGSMLPSIRKRLAPKRVNSIEVTIGIGCDTEHFSVLRMA